MNSWGVKSSKLFGLSVVMPYPMAALPKRDAKWFNHYPKYFAIALRPYSKLESHTLPSVEAPVRCRLAGTSRARGIAAPTNITSAMLSILGRAGAILLAVVDVSHAPYA